MEKKRPIIVAGRLVRLAPLELDDWRTFYAEMNDLELNATLGSFRRGFVTKAEEKESVEKMLTDKSARYMIILNENNEPVGFVTITRIDNYHGKAEIGYLVFRRFWGRGYATEAVRLAIDFAFRQLNLRKLYAYTFSSNTASQKVLEKNGFQRVGVLRKHAYNPRTQMYEDMYVYDLLREE